MTFISLKTQGRTFETRENIQWNQIADVRIVCETIVFDLEIFGDKTSIKNAEYCVVVDTFSDQHFVVCKSNKATCKRIEKSIVDKLKTIAETNRNNVNFNPVHGFSTMGLDMKGIE